MPDRTLINSTESTVQSCVIFFLCLLLPPTEAGSVAILDEALLYFGLLIGALMTGWALWMLLLYIKKTPEQRKRSSVGLWIIILALLLGLGALGKPMRTVIERILNSHAIQNKHGEKTLALATVEGRLQMRKSEPDAAFQLQAR